MPLADAMFAADMESVIDAAWETPEAVTTHTTGMIRESVLHAMKLMDSGKVRVAEPLPDGSWHVNESLKKAILLYFKLHRMEEIPGAPEGTIWWDKIPNKFSRWTGAQFHEAGFRIVPNCVVRFSAFIDRNVVLMPSFINVGARIESGTMIDTWSTVGSCAQIGKNCHISGHVDIGGVINPVQAAPVIVEDDVFIGPHTKIGAGIRIGKGAVISTGTIVNAATKIIDRDSGKIYQGHIPSYAVVTPGTLPGKNFPDGSPGPSLPCVVIIKHINRETQQAAIEELGLGVIGSKFLSG